jgi:hypothetical protein
VEHQPTILETQLDSICLVLGKMKVKLERAQLLEHITEKERAELEAALSRAEGKLTELSAAIHGSD